MGRPLWVGHHDIMNQKEFDIIRSTIFNSKSICASRQKRKDLLDELYLTLKSRTAAFIFNGVEYGGYRDPNFSEVEDGVGGIMGRYIVTHLDTGKTAGILSHTAEGWYFFDYKINDGYRVDGILERL